MKRSELFTKTSKTAPADEVAKNAQLLIRAGFIDKQMAGVYAFLPLGLHVIENIKKIIREEMNNIGGQELLMTTLQPREIWETTTRWSDDVVDIWFKTRLANDEEIGLAWSHEEPILMVAQKFVKSYKDLPLSVYQFQTKLRNEKRAKSGIMRGREFLMKDMYSMHADSHDLDAYYNGVVEAYKQIYRRLGIGDDTYVTYASGGAFTKFSHEFQTVCEAGEDTIYLHQAKNLAINDEVWDTPEVAEELKKVGVERAGFVKVKSAEVGNIFNFGDDKAKQMGITFADENNEQKTPFFASYGIGVSRLMGVIAEKFSDEKGLVWPENIAPFRVYLANLSEDEDVISETRKIYEELTANGVEVLWDDREDARAGEKFADADLMGIPWRVVVSRKTLEQKSVELKSRTGEGTEIISREELLARLK